MAASTAATVAVACVAMFQAVTKEGDRALYFSDGATTKKLIDLVDAPGADAYSFTSVGKGNVLFSNTSEAAGRELWITNGAAAGTRLLKDINPGAASSSPGGGWSASRNTRFETIGDRAIFPAVTKLQGHEMWTSDGTAAGTQILTDQLPGPGNGAGHPPANPLVFSNGAFAIYSDFGSNIWATHGIGGEQVLKWKSGVAIYPGLGTVGNRILFGPDLWVTNGTAARTRSLKPASSPNWRVWSISRLRGMPYALLSVTTNSVDSRELWVTDGTEGGTKRLGNVNLYNWGSNNDPFVKIGSKVYFVATNVIANNPAGQELWVTQGTAATTKRAVVLAPTPQFTSFAPLGSKLYFTAKATQEGYSFAVNRAFVTDGTTAGTRMLSTLLTPAGPLLSLHNRVVFPVSSSGQVALWAAGSGLAAPVKVSYNFSKIVGMQNVEIRSPNGVNTPCAK